MYRATGGTTGTGGTESKIYNEIFSHESLFSRKIALNIYPAHVHVIEIQLGGFRGGLFLISSVSKILLYRMIRVRTRVCFFFDIVLNIFLKKKYAKSGEY